MSEKPGPRLSVIIPSLKGQVGQLIESLAHQTWIPDEIEVVVGIKPNGKARNLGVSRTTGDILVFIDDDAMPGQNTLLETVIQPLLQDESIGICGPARVLPPHANAFQHRVAQEIPRTVNPVPVALLETNPPVTGYGHSLITTTCCATRREVYDRVGGFEEALTSGVDTDFFYRVRKSGYRFVMAPGVFVEHPAPGNLLSLWKKFYWYGLGYGQEAQRRPQQKLGWALPTPVHRFFFILGATLWLVPNIFFLYSFGYPYFEFGFRPLKALSTYAVSWGYLKAWQEGVS
jgi:GT2 family glycosyltransferase